MISRQDVLFARSRIAPYLRRTPLLAADQVWFKCEFLQTTGVFKARGAFNRQLAAAEREELDPEVGIVTASGGNAGLANAYAASVLGVRARVFVPENAPAVKVARLRAYGAQVVAVGSEYAQAYAAAVAEAQRSGAVFCHAYDQPEVVAGAGTIGEEILEDAQEVDTVVVAAGGGGLFAGIAASVEGRARVVVVEPQTCATLNAALAAGGPLDVPVEGVAADSLGARRVGDIAWSLARRTAPVSVLVSDQAIVEARTRLWQQYRIPAEYGAATAYAALTSGAYTPQRGEHVAVVVCGANTDATTLAD